MEQDDGKRTVPVVPAGEKPASEREANGDADAAMDPIPAADDSASAEGRAAPLLRDDVAPPPAPALLHDDADAIPPPALLHVAAPVQVGARLLAAVRALLREGPAAFAIAAAYRDVAGDGDLGLAAWARHGVIYPALLLARAAAAVFLAGAHSLVAHLPARACLLALLREAPAAFAIAAAYGYRNDGDLGLAAWARHGVIYPALLLAGAAAVRAAAVLAGHPLAAALGLRPVDAVRDILVAILALAAALAAIYFP